MAPLLESDIEKYALTLLQQQGYAYITREQQEGERRGTADVVLHDRLREAIYKLNRNLPELVRDHALREATALTGQNLTESNEKFYDMLIEGVRDVYQKDGETVGVHVQLIDFDNPQNNDFAVCNQFSVTEGNITKRPDVVLFVNGLPVVVIELKSPTDEKATVETGFRQLQTYKAAIPSLFCYNAVLVTSDGFDARAGSLTAAWSRFMAWKTVDGAKEDAKTTPQVETLVKGMLRPDVLLDLMRNFTVFENTTATHAGSISIQKEKKIAAYHQYHAVREALESTIRASRAGGPTVVESPERYGLHSVREQPMGDRKAGVMWHTQGSGKSLSMLFYTGLIVTNREMSNPTVVVITDRNDLDAQLFEAFAAGEKLLRQPPVQAQSRQHVKELLQTAGGGVVFSTIQKFSPEGDGEEFECLSDRNNIVVIADEAHRSQYGFGAKTHFMKDGAKTNYGFAKYLRDALPGASFIGFTATPIESEDVSTPAVFGNYIDIYDIEQAVADGATVPIYYESRLVQVHLKPDKRKELDAAVDVITESADATASQKAKAKWSKLEAIIGHSERIKTVASDILKHFEERRKVSYGKAMIVTTSRRIAVEMYAELTKLRPSWHSEDGDKGAIKVVMTSSSSDPLHWQQHATTKPERQAIRRRFVDAQSSLQIVMVCDMWLTGFDAPCLDAIYVDKLMSGHNLMQAIARVNRVHEGKPGGLVVDYIGIASDLKRALATYTKSGGRGAPTIDRSEAVLKMLEKHDVVGGMLGNFNYKDYFTTADAGAKLEIILATEDYVLGLDDGKERFTKEVNLLLKAFTLSVPDPKAMAIKAEVAFFQAVKSRINKFAPEGGGKSDAEMELAIKQIVDSAVVVGGVIDIFDAAGIKKPDISILSEDFLAEIKGMKHKNLAMELLKKLLNDELTSRAKKNLAMSKKFSEMLSDAINKYKNNLLTAAQIVEELIGIAREIQASDGRAGEMGLSDDEIAFYDALAMNESAKAVMGDDTLKNLARMLVDHVQTNATLDWTVKESVRAKLRALVRRLLNKYGYPPDEQKIATDRIMEQAELKAEQWLGDGGGHRDG